ncbi:hypothetical protein CAPI_08285 [Corynebacterium capitovis DSM 44611]|nr:hypothetical protein [Corynebacterium capitovis]WKD58184.1 hypothetical protein CAPI_08285 [Corynebacterium capitovis DSM 44611]
MSSTLSSAPSILLKLFGGVTTALEPFLDIAGGVSTLLGLFV